MRTAALVCPSVVALENICSWRGRGAQVRAKLITNARLRLGHRVMDTKRRQVRSEIRTKCLQKQHKYAALLRLLGQKTTG